MFWGLADLLSLSPFELGPSLVLKAAVYLCFFGFLRPGEVSRAGLHAPVLRKGSLTRLPDHFLLQLPNNKNCQVGPGFVINYYRTNTAWCPVEVLDQLTCLFSAAPLDSLLLPFPTQGLCSSQFISHVKILIGRLGLTRDSSLGTLSGLGQHLRLPSRGSLPFMSLSTWDAGNNLATVGTFRIPT